ncbi:wall-associated receptor kinase 3-like [Panicum miliaceum]|uniref:Wall-associated receptor kinase 3-like n=1 Tax=Panicum miliaceum TaxID=4540 RepID=A0A3L6Q7G1_PANMI|nr:wall-associated receptor kinase 3-like [Panicum miliaceum]
MAKEYTRHLFFHYRRPRKRPGRTAKNSLRFISISARSRGNGVGLGREGDTEPSGLLDPSFFMTFGPLRILRRSLGHVMFTRADRDFHAPPKDFLRVRSFAGSLLGALILWMARIKETAKLVESEEGVAGGEGSHQPAAHKEDLRFGSSKVSQKLIDYYVSKGFFMSGDCRPPHDEDIPNPQGGEYVVFHDFFTAWLQFPLDVNFPEILARYNVKMHHLTPNAIIHFSKFFWAVKTFEAPVSVDTFCRFYDMHPQGRKISFDSDDEVYSA